MAKNYLNPVIFFSIVCPVIFLLLIYIVCSKVLTNDKTKLAEKVSNYDQNQLIINRVNQLKTSTKANSEQLEEWIQLLDSEPSTRIMDSIKTSINTYENEITQTSFSRSRTSTLASELKFPSSAWDFSLRGSFRAIQKSLHKLESENPHIILERLEIKQDQSSNSLTTSATYSAWSSNEL